MITAALATRGEDLRSRLPFRIVSYHCCGSGPGPCRRSVAWRVPVGASQNALLGPTKSEGDLVGPPRATDPGGRPKPWLYFMVLAQPVPTTL